MSTALKYQNKVQTAVAKIKTIWAKLDKEAQYMAIAVGLCIVGFAIYQASSALTQHQVEAVNLEKPFEMDLAIPEGWSLVPLGNISNQAALDAVVQQYALVDVFAVEQTGKPSDIALLKDARLVRLPLDQRQFAVVVPGEYVPRIAQNSAVFVTVKNPKHAQKTHPGERKYSRISIGGEK